MHTKHTHLRDIEEEIMEALFDLHLSLCDDSYLKMKQILDRLGNQITKTQLTNIVQRKLEKLEYVHYTPYEGVRLTSKGYEIARKVARNHRLAEAMLFQLFNVPFEIIHEQACLLEHAISDELAEYIYNALPEKITPFGITIPMKVREEFACSDQTLLDTPKGLSVKISRISIHTHETAKILLSLGINGVGEEILVQQVQEDGVSILIRDKEYLVPTDLANIIFVDPI